MTWEPIETAPKDGTKILTWYEAGSVEFVHITFWSNDENDDWSQQGFDSKEEAVGWWSYVDNCVSQQKLEASQTPKYWMTYNKPGAA